MSTVFLDTSGLVAVVNVEDQWHAAASSVWHGLVSAHTPFVTTSLVLAEFGDTMSRVRHRALAVTFRTRLLQLINAHIVPFEAGIESRAWDLFGKRSDKEWSLTDCCSFVAMSDLEIRRAFTIDHHFEQAGFERLIEQKAV